MDNPFRELDDFFVEKHGLKPVSKELYVLAFKALSRHTGNPFNLDRKQFHLAIGEMEKLLKPASWNTYVVRIRTWYKWRYGNDEQYPDAVRRVQMKKVTWLKYARTKILTVSEIRAMIRALDHPRDRAIIAVLASVGARRGGMLLMRIRDLEPKPYGYEVVYVGGKTETEEPPSILGDFAKIVRVWLEHHPARDNPDAPLWVRLRSGHWGGRLEPIRRVALHNIVKKAARAAGIKRNVHLQMFRHTAATECAKQPGIGEAQLRRLFGWTVKSDMPKRYVNLAKGDARKAYLAAHGIGKVEPEKPSFQPVQCAYCGYENASISKYCGFCGIPISEKEAEKLVERQRLLEEAARLLTPKILKKLRELDNSL